jgi:hypothetical protein
MVLAAAMTLAAAQQPPAAPQLDQVLQLEECLNRVDATAMQALEARSEQAQDEVRALCAAGDREGAEKRAAAFARELAASRETLLVRDCGEMARQMFAAMPPNARATQDPPFEMGHVCDSEE